MRHRPYKVVCKASDPQWLEERKDRLTGTGVSAMLGVNPWVTREQYIDEKLSGYQLVPSKPMLSGGFDEQHNMKKFSWITGLRTRPTNLFLASTVTVYPGLASTIDGCIIPPKNGREPRPIPAMDDPWVYELYNSLQWAEGPGLIEMKQTNIFTGRKLWLKAAEGPEHYVLQLQTQLHVTGLHWGVLCARVGAHDMKAFYVERNDSVEFIENLLQVCEDFQTLVVDQRGD